MNFAFYYSPACSTCKKALALLRSTGRVFPRHDIVATPPSSQEITLLWGKSGLPLSRFFHRAAGFGGRLSSMSDAEKLAALAADGKRIKRPILAFYDESNGHVQ